MPITTIQITINGKAVDVPCTFIQHRTVMARGRWAKIISIQDEELLPGPPILDLPDFITKLKASPLKGDWLTFSQKFTDTRPHFPYHYEFDNVAAIPLTTYDDWWERQVSHDLRKDIKRAEKRGVVVQTVDLNDDLVKGISTIYDETPIRQGRAFWHYRKPLPLVKLKNSSYLERSQFLGAFCSGSLIGFIKIVYVDDTARMMQILSMDAHQDKRPTNALIAKAVEEACRKGCQYLTYGRYTYGNKRNSSIVQFKRRNGFEEILFPRYYIPLSFRGAVLIGLGLQSGLKRFIPERVMNLLLGARKLAMRTMHTRSAPNDREAANEAGTAPDKP